MTAEQAEAIIRSLSVLSFFSSIVPLALWLLGVCAWNLNEIRKALKEKR